MADTNYSSGDDYIVEFLGYRFSFNGADFEQRVTGAAVKLGLVEANELDDDETDDLVELAAEGRIEEPRSSLGRISSRRWAKPEMLSAKTSFIQTVCSSLPWGAFGRGSRGAVWLMTCSRFSRAMWPVASATASTRSCAAVCRSRR